MARKHELQVANFICKFGEKNLLDLPQITLSVFTDRNLIRKYGLTRFFLHNVAIHNFGTRENPHLCISGRFIKDTFLKREQVYDENKGLVEDDLSIKSAPSAKFLLYLNDHRIVYIGETAYAPKLDTFATTLSRFYHQVHKNFIDQLYVKKKDEGKGIEKYQLTMKYPFPILRIVPLSSDESFESFVHRFSKLQIIKLKIVETNNELDSEAFFEAFRDMHDGIGSAVSSIEHRKKEGMEKREVVERYKNIPKLGTHRVTLQGVDSNGDTLKGNNDDFNLRIPIEQLPEDNKESASFLFEKYITLKKAGTIKEPKRVETIKDKLVRVLSLL